MKKLLLLCFAVLFKMSFAQDASVAFDSKEMKNFLSGTLYIISTGNASFDSSLASSVKQYWKMTPYQMVAKADAETYLKDESKYLLVFVHQKNLQYMELTSPDKLDNNYDVNVALWIIKGQKKKTIEWNMATCNFPFSIFNLNIGTQYVVKELNDIISTTVNNKIDPDKPSGDKINFHKLFCTNPAILKDRILLIPSNLSDHILPETILSGYKYKYKVVTPKEMVNLFTADAASYCFVPVDCIENIRIYDPVTKALIYSGPIEVSLSMKHAGDLNKKEVEDLNKAIEGHK